MRRTLVCVLGTCLLAGQMPPPSTQQPAPVIKVTTHTVQVNVVVHDKKGQPVADLKKGDFAVFDKGQEQKIRSFSVENAAAARPPQPLPAGVFSNRESNAAGGSAPAEPHAVTAILLDGLNSTFDDQRMAREGLIGFLLQIQPGDQVALYLLTNGLHVLHDFTSDSVSLVAAVQRYKAGQSWKLDASTAVDANSSNAEMDAYLNHANDLVNAFYQARRLETTLAAFTTIANHLAGIPGRKNLIWLSGGFPLFVGTRPNGSPSREFQDFSAPMQRAVRAINAAGVAVYPVDERGLLTDAEIMPGRSVRTPPRIAPDARIQSPAQARADIRAAQNFADTQSTMLDIADRTGGRAFMNSNDIAGGIHRAVADAQVSYAITYSPSHNQWDGEFREIKIKVNRPGLEARYRKGYYAVAESPSDAELGKTEVVTAATSPLVFTGLELRANVLDQPSAASPRTRVHLVVEAQGVTFTLNDQKLWDAALDLLLLVRDGQGGTLNQVSREIILALKQDQYEMLQKNGISMTLVLQAPPQSVGVRAVVRDRNNGAMGTLDIPLAR